LLWLRKSPRIDWQEKEKEKIATVASKGKGGKKFMRVH